MHPFELPEGAIPPRTKDDGMDVYGCGLVLDPDDKLAVFFTLNGKLMGELVLEILRININIQKSSACPAPPPRLDQYPKIICTIICNKLNLRSIIINGLINLNLQVGKFESVLR
jgi:hypothetical protein